MCTKTLAYSLIFKKYIKKTIRISQCSWKGTGNNDEKGTHRSKTYAFIEIMRNIYKYIEKERSNDNSLQYTQKRTTSVLVEADHRLEGTTQKNNDKARRRESALTRYTGEIAGSEQPRDSEEHMESPGEHRH